jgi:glycosyltransferase involved in cell wall biosynthesis
VAAPPLHLALVIDQLHGGGAEHQALRLANALVASRRCRATLLTLRQQPASVRANLAAGVELVELGRTGEVGPRLIRDLRGELARCAPDVIHAWLPRACLCAGLARPRAAPLVFGYLNSGYADQANRVRYGWRGYLAHRLLRRRPAVHLFNSEVGRRNWVAICGLDLQRCRVLPNYVPFDDGGNPRDPNRSRNSPPALLCAGRLKLPEKGQDTLLAALPLLEERVGPVRLQLAGDGPDRDRIARRATDRVELLGWVEDLRPLREAADLFVLPSRAEGFPNSLLEAMAEAMPVAATRVGAVEEMTDGGRVARLAAPDDPGSLANAMAAALEEGEGLGRSGSAFVRERFAPEKVLAAYASFYDEVASR